MKIGIVFYSHRGHTQAVVEKLAARLAERGLPASMFKLEPSVPLNLSVERVSIKEIPELRTYDALVLGTPVHGGRMSAPLRTYFDNVASLEGIKVAFLVTHFFRRAWGAEQTLQALASECETKGAQVLGEANVKWFSLRRKQGIARAVEGVSALF